METTYPKHRTVNKHIQMKKNANIYAGCYYFFIFIFLMQVDCCPFSCMLYDGDHATDDKCHHCREERYMTNDELLDPPVRGRIWMNYEHTAQFWNKL